MYVHRHSPILHPALHWIHAELAEQPAGLGGGRREGNLKPDLPGDRVPPPQPRAQPAFQRRQHETLWVRHPLCHWRKVHFCRTTVSTSNHPPGRRGSVPLWWGGLGVIKQTHGRLTEPLSASCPLFPEPRQSSVISHRKFLAHRVTSTSTRTTCGTSRRNTGKVMESELSRQL